MKQAPEGRATEPGTELSGVRSTLRPIDSCPSARCGSHRGATPCVRLLVAPVMRSLSSPDVLGVAMSYAKRRAVHGAVREFLVRVLAAAGLATGLLVGASATRAAAGRCVQTGWRAVSRQLLQRDAALDVASVYHRHGDRARGRRRHRVSHQRPHQGTSPTRTTRGVGGNAAKGERRTMDRCSLRRPLRELPLRGSRGDRVYHRPRRTVCNRCN